jgi:LemA protein
MFDFEVKPNFTVANEAQISTAPKVDFGTGVAPQAQQGMSQGAGGAATAPGPTTGPEKPAPAK